MPKNKAAAKLAKRVLRAAGAGNLAELQQIVAAASTDVTAAAGESEPPDTGRSPLLECADADECQPLVQNTQDCAFPHRLANLPAAAPAHVDADSNSS